MSLENFQTKLNSVSDSSSKKFYEKSKEINQLRIKKDVLGYLALFFEGNLFLIYY